MNSTPSGKSQSRALPSADQVALYLERHPEFFESETELLERLQLPHASGDAVSLVARQLQLLREKGDRLSRQLDELLTIARENETLSQRIHQLILEMILAPNIEDLVAGLSEGVRDHLRADFCSVHLCEPCRDSPLEGLLIPAAGPHQALCEQMVNRTEPLHGRPEAEVAQFLYGEEGADVASHFVLPFGQSGIRGLLAIGSRDPERFNVRRDFDLLQRLADLLAASLAKRLG